MRKTILFIFLFISLFSFRAFAEEVIPEIPVEVTETTENDPEPEIEIVTVDITPPTETVLIRNGDTVIYSGTVPLPASGTIDITDHSGTVHTVNANSVLGFLYALDQTNDSFSISDLEYYSSYNAFYLKCLLPQGGTEACDSWQYVVNNTTPWTGMDGTILSGNESIGLYFGSPHQATFDKTTVTVGDAIIATTQKYNYTDNTWSPLSEVTIGVTVSNPEDPWNPTVISETPVDMNGAATITIADAGTYIIGIKEDYYFPSYTITVTAKEPVKDTNTGGGTGGGSTTKQIPTFDVSAAIDFLSSAQKTDGSYGSPLFSDWTAIAFAANASTGPALNALKTYISSITDAGPLTTDAERHAMALESLGINPYSGTATDFIKKITDAYDGTQVGDPSLVNDDIFAIFPLMHAGYTTDDPIIKNTVAFIISKQSADGGFGSIDMTAAAIQALTEVSTLPDTTAVITKAKSYLQSHEQNGGWDNGFSTSWALQGIAALGESPDTWKQSDATPLTYLAALQQPDGGMENTSTVIDTRVWATAYAVPAALGKTWGSILSSFPKPTVEQSTGGGGGGTVTDTKTDDLEKAITEKEKTDTPVDTQTENTVTPLETVETEVAIIANTDTKTTQTTTPTKISIAPVQEKITSVSTTEITPTPRLSQTAAASDSGATVPLPVTVAVATLGIGGLGFAVLKMLALI